MQRSFMSGGLVAPHILSYDASSICQQYINKTHQNCWVYMLKQQIKHKAVTMITKEGCPMRYDKLFNKAIAVQCQRVLGA